MGNFDESIPASGHNYRVTPRGNQRGGKWNWIPETEG